MSVLLALVQENLNVQIQKEQMAVKIQDLLVVEVVLNGEEPKELEDQQEARAEAR